MRTVRRSSTGVCTPLLESNEYFNQENSNSPSGDYQRANSIKYLSIEISMSTKKTNICRIIKARNQSGGNAESMFAEAKELYIIKEPKNQPFKFDHAWKILKFHVKWAEPVGPN
ncbi:hypothetical protein ACP275_08G111000 [Erythranthe tilingii]